MKSFFTLIICLFGLLLNAQNRFTQIIEASEYSATTNDLEKWNTLDFSPLIKGMPDTHPLGVIGDGYRRIQIKIVEVTKDATRKNEYHIKGKSKVGKNIEVFEGVLTLQNIRQIKPRTLEEHAVSLPSIYEGVVTGVYEFKEPTNTEHSGVFKGTYQGMFQITEENELFYNDLDLYRDSYINNVFEGTWTDYKTNDVKLCKWADFRVPNVAADFDLGAGEFSPNEKYNNKGWKTYNDAYLHNNRKAIEKEEEIWWD